MSAPAAARAGLAAVAITVGTVAAAMTAVLEVFWVPLRAPDLFPGDLRWPLSLFLAAVFNVVIARWTSWASGLRLAALAPALVWLAVVAVLSGGRAEGDMLVAADNWVGIGLPLVGFGSLLLAGYLTVNGSGQARRPARS